MNITPDFVRHPKFMFLKRKIGDIAAECLLRIFSHAQENQRGPNWGQITPAYIAAICEWRGDPGQLWDALTTSEIPGKAAWLDVLGDGSVIVHDWDVHNAGLLSAWENGRKPKRAAAYRPVSDRSPAGKPSCKAIESKRIRGNGRGLKDSDRPKAGLTRKRGYLVADQILGGLGMWDSCRIQARMLNRDALASAAYQWLDAGVAEDRLLTAWTKAVKLAHQFIVDGTPPVRYPAGYVVSCWHDQLTKAQQAPATKNPTAVAAGDILSRILPAEGHTNENQDQN